MNDAAPNGAQSDMVGGGYRDAAPTVLQQQAREWGQSGTCPSQKRIMAGLRTLYGRASIKATRPSKSVVNTR